MPGVESAALPRHIDSPGDQGSRGSQEPLKSSHKRKVTKTLAPELAAMLWKGQPDIWMFFLRRTGFGSPENMLITRVRQEGV